MQLGSGAPFRDGDRTAESINGAAIPLLRNPGRIPDISGPLLRRVRRPADSKVIRVSRRHRNISYPTDASKAAR
jgi:hypothetical protein